ncbi:MAG: PIN domain-containing protein [Bacteroidales bacterium]
MILVDTSVWVEFFTQQRVYADHIRVLLKKKAVITLEPIFSELLYGVSNRQEYEVIHSFWQMLPKIEFSNGSMIEAASLARQRNYHLMGIGVLDAAIIKATEDGEHRLWTLNGRINDHIRKPLIYQPGFMAA